MSSSSFSAGAESWSSSSPNLKWSYDVFLSFRGEDTRSNFTSHLDTALRQRGVNFFIDDKLDRGGQISESLLKSIEGSRISIIIFSQNYASSTWCLDELLKIIECMKSNGQLVFPVFYKVDPSEVRKQTGSFGQALAKHVANYKFMTNKIQTWKEALTTAAGLSGWDLATRRDEADLIQEIVKQVLSVVNGTQLLQVAKHPVGVDSQLRAMEELTSHVVVSDGVNMVGIHGMGGIGKTTLAKALYNQIADQFEACSFLPNVREASEQFNGLVQLQEKLLHEILKDNHLHVDNVHKGMNIISDRLCSKKVLIVLDDVDKAEQLDALIGGRNWFGRGSKIIVTTRDRHLLAKQPFDKVHTIQLLDPNKSLELFCWHAFNKNHPSSNYLDLSKLAVNYCRGLPLALVILGSLLHKREQIIWESKLDELEKSLEPAIEAVFQISFKGLEDKVKEIFLDISCFFVGEDVNYIKDMLKACDLNPDYGITILMDLSLVTVEDGKIKMHDLIRQMGQTIVFRESSEPEKRSRLWVAEEVINMLKENAATDAVEAIKLNYFGWKSVEIDPKAFRNMKKLRMLILRGINFSKSIFECLPNKLKCIECSKLKIGNRSSLPTSFFVNEKLVGLNVRCSFVKCLGKRFENCEKLKHVDLSYCTDRLGIHDLSATLNLEKLYLRDCISLKMIHASGGSLSKLTTLNLEGCVNLKKLPSYLVVKSLQLLNLSRCKKLEEIPDLSAASNLKELYLRDCKCLRIIHDSVGHSLDKLVTLDLKRCDKLERLPSYVMSESLEYLDLSYCRKLETSSYNFSLEKFPSDLKFKYLKVLNLNHCRNLEEIPDVSIASNLEKLYFNNCSNLRRIHESIGSLDKLVTLKLDSCYKLEKLPGYLRLKSLASLSLGGCRTLEQLPEFDENMKSLREMNLESTAIKELSSSIRYLIGLENLNLSRCIYLIALPSEIHLLKSLKELRLCGCLRLEMFPPRSSLNFHQETSLCSKLTILDLENCNISNVDFLEILSNVCCTSLRELYLSRNKFSCLPSLHNFTSLRYLELSDCKFLEKILKLPHCLHRVNAWGCELLFISLEHIADLIFGNQDLEFIGSVRKVLLTNSEIPKHLGNQTTESSVSVNIQHNPNKRQALVICVAFNVNGDSSKAKNFIKYGISINGKTSKDFWTLCPWSKSEYMWLKITPLALCSSDVNNDGHNIQGSFEVSDPFNNKANVTIRSHSVLVVDELNANTNCR